ncbi:MAG: hypothetical protein AAFX93_03410 [Verrucomicrobiota bacterium]
MKNPQFIALGAGIAAIAVAFIFLLPEGDESAPSEGGSAEHSTSSHLENEEVAASEWIETEVEPKSEEAADASLEDKGEFIAASIDGPTSLSPAILDMIQHEYYGIGDVLDVMPSEGPERVANLIDAYRASGNRPGHFQDALMNELSYEDEGNTNIYALMISELVSGDPEARQRSYNNIMYYEDEGIIEYLEKVKIPDGDYELGQMLHELKDWLNTPGYWEVYGDKYAKANDAERQQMYNDLLKQAEANRTDKQ